MELSRSQARKAGAPRSAFSFPQWLGMPEFRVAFKGSKELLGGLFLLSSLSTTGCLFSTAKPAPRVFRPPPVQVQPVVEAEIFIEESGPKLEFEAPENPAEIATLRMPEFPAPP